MIHFGIIHRIKRSVGYSIGRKRQTIKIRSKRIFHLPRLHFISISSTFSPSLGVASKLWVSMKLLFLAPLLGTASAAVIEHWWNVSRALANPDGVSPSLRTSVTL